jgi:hypothetical protein
VAAGLVEPGAEWPALRALQLAWFTTTLLLDEDDGIATALAGVPGLDVPRVMEMLDGPEVAAAYEADREAARTAAGSPTEFQGKAANTDGRVRYTAPSILFRRADGTALEAGGYQPVEAYDVVVANLERALTRTEAATGPLEVLERFPYGLTTQEIAAVMTPHLGVPDARAAEDDLLRLVANGQAVRTSLSGGALWSPPGAQVVAPPCEDRLAA